MFGIGRDDEAVAGTDLEGLAGDRESEATGLDESRLGMRMAVACAAGAGRKVVRDNHEFGTVSEDLADDSGVRGDGRKGLGWGGHDRTVQ